MKSVLIAPLVCAALCAFMLAALLETIFRGRSVLTDTWPDSEEGGES